MSSNFQSSYAVYMCLMVATTCVHIVLPWLVPSETTMSAIYLPPCFCVCATRVYVKRMADQHRAHDILCRVWVFNVFVSFSLHRWCLIIGLQSPTGINEGQIYMGTLMLLAILLHVSFFSFRYRVAILGWFITRSRWLVGGILAGRSRLAQLERCGAAVRHARPGWVHPIRRHSRPQR